jgi:hypothetical protein
MVANFYRGALTRTIPVNVEHKPGEYGTLGHIHELRLNLDGSISAKIRWNSHGAIAIIEDRYRYISPEHCPKWEDPLTEEPFEDVLAGIALTNGPFFKELRPRIGELIRL